MPKRGIASRIGRVRVVEMVAPVPGAPIADPLAGTDLDLRWTQDEGSIELAIFSEEAQELASYRVSSQLHDDVHLGRFSMPDANHCYGSQLAVVESARGRGLGRATVICGRRLAAQEFGRGVRCLVETTNIASLRCNTAAGLAVERRLFGLRFGGAVRWLRVRSVT